MTQDPIRRGGCCFLEQRKQSLIKWIVSASSSCMTNINDICMASIDCYILPFVQKWFLAQYMMWCCYDVLRSSRATHFTVYINLLHLNVCTLKIIKDVEPSLSGQWIFITCSQWKCGGKRPMGELICFWIYITWQCTEVQRKRTDDNGGTKIWSYRLELILDILD